jgi:hypothetical protein
MSDKAVAGVIRLGWDCPHHTGAGSSRGTGSDQTVVVAAVTGMSTQGGQGWQGWPRREQHNRGGDNGAAVTGTTSPLQGRGGGGWGRASAAVVEAPAVTSTDVPMQVETVLTGMFQAALIHEQPHWQMQSQEEYQSTGPEPQDSGQGPAGGSTDAADGQPRPRGKRAGKKAAQSGPQGRRTTCISGIMIFQSDSTMSSV